MPGDDGGRLALRARALQCRGEELVMPEHSSMHFYLNWTKERLDEMDATLASLEAKASQLESGREGKGGAIDR